MTLVITSSKQKILEGLKRKSMHGYEISKELKVPISSVYEHLRYLREKGFVRFEKRERKRVYRLTKRGEYLLRALNNIGDA